MESSGLGEDTSAQLNIDCVNRFRYLSKEQFTARELVLL